MPAPLHAPTRSSELRSILRPAVRCLAIAVALVCGILPAAAAPPRALPEGKLPADVRLKEPKDYDGYFPFQPSASKQAWENRSAEVRRQMQIALNLWPRPTSTPLNPVIHGKIERDGYTVEKVFFESVPGFFVTGNLYRPTKLNGKAPGVLCPHGHWSDGRFYDQGEGGVRKQIVIGAERFEEGGRSPLQARCMQLARMGCVVFHYDMIGYADSVQITRELAHGFAKQRPEANTVENWGLFSTQAEAHLQSVMGLQTWNSIRALDFLLSLPEVDAQRIAVTGASGGGTQTMILAALDPRVTIAIPCVMVSTAMQGGCTCENCSLLRVNTGNIEFAALFAPKPQLLVSANDWTKEMPTKGFPELSAQYRLLGAADSVKHVANIHFEHNYNYVSRSAMYAFVNKQFKLGVPEPVVEDDYKRLSTSELSVWDEKHPAPASGQIDFERKLLRTLHDDCEKQLAQLTPTTKESSDKFREIVGGAAQTLFGRASASADELAFSETSSEKGSGHTRVVGLLQNKKYGEEIPVTLLKPEKPSGHAVIWVSEKGKAGLLDDAGAPRPGVAELLKAGVLVLGGDLLYQGEFLEGGKPFAQTPKVKNPREFAGYTYGFNDTVFVSRVHDLVSLAGLARKLDSGLKRVDICGLGAESGSLAAAAAAVSGKAIDRAAVHTAGFRFGKLTDYRDPKFTIGGAKYFDLPGLLALSAPRPLWLAGESSQPPAITLSAFKAVGAEKSLTISPTDEASAATAAAAWLVAE